jgi:hypothetical protein
MNLFAKGHIWLFAARGILFQARRAAIDCLGQGMRPLDDR